MATRVKLTFANGGYNRWIGYGSLHASDKSEFQWRFPLAFQVVPALILVIGMSFVPESPRYLIEKNEYAEAMRVLRMLHYDGSNDDWIEAEYREICQTIEAEKMVATPGWIAMFTIPRWRTRMLYVSLANPPLGSLKFMRSQL